MRLFTRIPNYSFIRRRNRIRNGNFINQQN